MLWPRLDIKLTMFTPIWFTPTPGSYYTSHIYHPCRVHRRRWNWSTTGMNTDHRLGMWWSPWHLLRIVYSVFTTSGNPKDMDIWVWVYRKKVPVNHVRIPYHNLWLKLNFILLQISLNSLQVRITVDFDYKDGVYHFIDCAVGNYTLASRVLEVLWLLNEKFAWIIDFNDLTISVLYGNRISFAAKELSRRTELVYQW